MNTTSLALQLEFSLPAAPLQVFEALCKTEQIMEWSGGIGAFEKTEGGKMYLFNGLVYGTIKEYMPGKALCFHWMMKDWENRFPASFVEIRFQAEGERTVVGLLHSEIPNEKEKGMLADFWNDYVFAPLEFFLEDL